MEDQKLDEIARLLTVLVRLETKTQADAIREMSKSGIRPSRIADLLGTTANTVNVTIVKAKKKEKTT